MSRRASRFLHDGKVLSSQHLLAVAGAGQREEGAKADASISALYLPSEKRIFKKKEKKKSKNAFPTAMLPKEEDEKPPKKAVQFDMDLVIDQLNDLVDTKIQE